MALINLEHISELANEALTNYELLQILCFNSGGEATQIPDEVFAVTVKTRWQAENLEAKLFKLHQVCSDFVDGNFGPYIEVFERWRDDTGGVFDPFDELDVCFNCDSPDDLPDRIEHYGELLQLSLTFSKIQQQKQASFHQMDSKQPWYNTESEHQRRVNEEIKAVQVEYCLDHYNLFYEQATGLLSAHRGGDILTCSEAILDLFSPQ
ncbi:hypothetical protein [Spirosoma gilvum]